MSLHLQRRISKIKDQVLNLGNIVEQTFLRASQAVSELDAELATEVVQGDTRIDAMEIDLEEECLATLALEQPVANDLRFVVAVLKMNNDLERIADLAANIAGQARFLAGKPRIDVIPFDLDGMKEKVHGMLRRALDALISEETSLAEVVVRTDDEVDEMYSRMYVDVQDAIRKQPENLSQLIHYLSIARMLERIADHACNIAEDVLYLERGEIFRHGQGGILDPKPR